MVTSLNPPNPTSTRPFGIAFVAVAVLLVSLVAVMPQAHAVVRHGTEAEQIRQCLDKNGPEQIWKSNEQPNTFYQICKLEDGKYGLQAIKRVFEDGKWQYVEKTAFVKGDGTLASAIRYLSNFASKFTGALP